ncbi:ABC transporter [Desulfuribacillus stibiiarsenatis]|uniref:Transport permease protein n=1 Tax=Desulfuribacillus stibiiarsenatis TaxID=1390249 RepID=A0A1E5L8E9_9FIRM|nr:ABC transporter permease [Desulfuribacillus stibiiarsenatis]OEH86432.1 ABC transporter [Desulfuribacillus stibiiarsenatis]
MEAIYGIWYRDVIKFLRDKPRLFGALAMSFLFLIVFGSGLGGAMRSMMAVGGSTVTFDYAQYMFPGILAVTILNTSIFSALSVVQDKEYGYFKEILVSPIPRVFIVLGKGLGGTTVAVMQSLVMFIFAPLIGLKVTLLMVLQIIPVMFLLALTLSGVGLFLASTIQSSTGFQVIVQLLIFPMLFMSGAFFPLTGLPRWLELAVIFNPLTYAVDVFKKIILQLDQMPRELVEAMGLELQVFGYTVSIWQEIAMIVIVGIVFISLATRNFVRNT